MIESITTHKRKLQRIMFTSLQKPCEKDIRKPIDWLNMVHLLKDLFILAHKIISFAFTRSSSLLCMWSLSLWCPAFSVMNFLLCCPSKTSPSAIQWDLLAIWKEVGVEPSPSLMVQASAVPLSSTSSLKCCSVTFSVIDFGWVKAVVLLAFLPMSLLRKINNSRAMTAASEGLWSSLPVRHLLSPCQIPSSSQPAICYHEVQRKGRKERNPGTSPCLRERRIQIFYVEQMK